MSRALFLLLDLLGRHRRPAGWLTAAAAALAVTGGVALGAEGGPPADPATADPAATSVTRSVAARQTAVQGVIVQVRRQAILVRTVDGGRVLVRTDPQTRYRHAGKAVERTLLRRGLKVTVLGRADGEGGLRARAVVIRGKFPAPAPARGPGTPAAPTPSPVATPALPES